MNDDKNLAHHGILGQRWGIRRYQNPDGSLTLAGRKQAQKLKNQYKELTGKKLKGKIPKENPNTKSIKQLSDAELMDRIKRLRNEKEAHGLERDLSGKGKKFIRSVGSNVIAPAAIDAGKNLLTKVFMNVGSEALGLNSKDANNITKELKKSAEEAEYKYRKLKAETGYDQLVANEKARAKAAREAKKIEKINKSNSINVNSKEYTNLKKKGKSIYQDLFPDLVD